MITAPIIILISIAATQAAKQLAPKLPKWARPWLSALVGVLGNGFMTGWDVNSLATGMVEGFAGGGIYSGAAKYGLNALKLNSSGGKK